MDTKSPDRGEREKNVMVHRKGQTLLDSAGCAPARRGLRYRGVALVWSAILMLVIIGFVGLSIDWGKLAVNVHQMQNAADAAALAGAQIVKIESAEFTRQQTHDIGIANAAEGLAVTLRMDPQDEPFVDDTNLDIILGRWINHLRWFFPTLDTPDAVRVIARRADGLADAPALAMIFGPIFGVDTANARREAIGWANAIGGAGLIVLDTEPNDMSMPNYTVLPGLKIADKVGDIRVIGGTIHVNATGTGVNDAAAVYVKAGGRMQCGRLTVTGHTDPRPGSTDWNTIWRDDIGGQVPYDIWEGAPYLPDPLGPEGLNIQPPPIPTDASGNYIVKSYDETTDGSCTLYPGYYPGGIAVNSATTKVTLSPGDYLIGGGNPPGNTVNGLVVNGGELEARGVLIYLTKDYGYTDDPTDDGKWAKLDIGGNVVTNITPPGDLPENYVNGKPVVNGLPGISIWQDRANTANTASLHGEGDMRISGTLYFPENHVYLAGNPGKAGNQILCGSIEVFGRAQVLVNYDGRNNMFRRRAILVR